MFRDLGGCLLSPGWVTHLDLTWSVPPLARFLFWAPSLDDEETKAAYLRLTRSAVSPGSARSLMKLGYQIDWEAVLPRIHVPTLILHRTGDLVVPIARPGNWPRASSVPGSSSFPASTI